MATKRKRRSSTVAVASNVVDSSGARPSPQGPAAHRVRPSDMPAFTQCPSMARDWAAPIRAPHAMADLGSAVHAAMAAEVVGDTPDFGALSAAHDSDALDIAEMHAVGLRHLEALDEVLRADAATVQVEAPLAGSIWTGSADVVAEGGDTLVVVDWKSGRVHGDARPQVLSYLHAARDVYGRRDRYVGYVSWLRHNLIERFDATDADLDAHAERHADNLKRIGQQYNPGDACTYCPGRYECEARQSMIRSMVSSFAADTLAETNANISRLEKAIKEAKAAIRAALVDGPREGLQMVERTKQSIDPTLAWPLLRQAGMTNDQLADAMTLSVSKITKHAGKGVMDTLRREGAVSTTTYPVIIKHNGGNNE